MNTAFSLNKQIVSVDSHFIKINDKIYEIPEYVKLERDNSLIIDTENGRFYINGYEFADGNFIPAKISQTLSNAFLSTSEVLDMITSL